MVESVSRSHRSHKLLPSSVQDIHMVLYLQNRSESVRSKSAVEEIVHAVAWLHQMAGLPPAGASPIVQDTLHDLKRLLAKPKKHKEPVTAQMLHDMAMAAGPPPSLTEVGLLAICLVAFCWISKVRQAVEVKMQGYCGNQ